MQNQRSAPSKPWIASRSLMLAFAMTACLFLTNCGFHIRQKTDLPLQLKTLNLVSLNPHSDLKLLLQENFQELGVNVSLTASNTLTIINETFSQSSMALGTAQQLNTVNLYYTVTYALNDSRTTLTTTTSYLQNASQILGDTTVIPSLQQELLRKMVQQILSHLSAENTRRALSH